MPINSNQLNVSNIDYDDIKENLRTFLRSQTQFADFDFEGSAISSLIDLLAYVTHYNAVNANLGINEAFLDTAQFRGSVTGHARLLGYTPKSPSTATAYINIRVNDLPNVNFTLPQGFKLNASINGKSYPFVVSDNYETNDGLFLNVRIIQGTYQTVEYVYDPRSSEKFLIPERDIDNSHLIVEVYDSENSSNAPVTYIKGKSITSIVGTSNIYFIHENPDGYYEVVFGDDVLGRALNASNVVKITYLVTDKAEANGAGVFTAVGSIGGVSSLTITVNQRALGGGEREGIEQIRRNAPLTFASQNRAVTPDDFEAIIREGYPNAETIKVWGGEDNDNPIYGKVFIAIKPVGGLILSSQEKEYILSAIIKPKSVLTITPELVDPEFGFINLEVFFKFDPSKTTLTKVQLEQKVTDAIRAYNTEKLNRFDEVFRYSNLLRAIDNADPSVLNSSARVFIQKRFIPEVNVSRTYILNYSGDIYKSSGKSVITKSTRFTVSGISKCFFKDYLSEDGQTRYISIISKINNNEDKIIVKYAGTILNNKIILQAFAPSSFEGGSINIEVILNSNDIAPRNNTLLSIDTTNQFFKVTGDIDTIVSGREISGTNYITPPRHAE